METDTAGCSFPACWPEPSLAATNAGKVARCRHATHPHQLCVARMGYLASLPICPVCDDGCRIFPGWVYAFMVAGMVLPDGTDAFRYLMWGGRMDACIECWRVGGGPHMPFDYPPPRLGKFTGTKSKRAVASDYRIYNLLREYDGVPAS